MFRQTGRYGVVDKALLNILKDSGISEEEKQNILNFVPTNEKRNFIKMMSNVRTNPEVSPERENLSKYVRDTWYDKATKAGLKSDVAFAVSTLFSNHALRSNVDVENYKNWFDKTIITNKDLTAENENIYHQAAMKRSSFNNFDEFYNNVLNNRKNKNKEQFNYLSQDGINIRIPHDTIIHDEQKHQLTSEQWIDLLENIDNISDSALSKQKSSYSGKSILLKVVTQKNVYGIVLETFSKNNPIISTAFIDDEKNIDNWIKNEAIPSGTKTSFLGIRLNDIITNVQPKFKTKKINNVTYFQSAYHGTPHKFDEFSLDNIGSAYYQSDIRIKPINIEVDSLPNFEKVSELKQWIQDNLNLLGDVEIKDNNRIVHFSKSNIGRSMKGINRNDAKRNSYVALKELVENSVYGYTKPVDERHNKRNNGQEIYHNAFNYNGDVYGIEISIDIPKSDNNTHRYAGHKIKIIKKTPAVNGTKIPDVTGATISITDIQKLFNPNVTEHEEKTYFQSVYHGTPHRFDEFSLENIGSGEGAQAHGWGLYFAENKDVTMENLNLTLVMIFLILFIIRNGTYHKK